MEPFKLEHPADPRGGMQSQPDFDVIAVMDNGNTRNGVSGVLRDGLAPPAD